MRRVLAASLLCAAACAPAEVVGGETYAEVVELPALPNPKLDLLFIIDNSPSMLDAQSSLTASFPRMMDVLEELDGGLPDLHIAVATSDLGASTQTSVGGTGIAGSSCVGIGDDGAFRPHRGARFLRDIDDGHGGRLRNYEGSLGAAFQALASAGSAGCGFEQHFGAIQRALENPVNAGFLRPEANLAVIIVADEDDCTALSPDLLAPDNAALGPRQSFRCTAFGVTCDQPWNLLGEKTNCVPRTDSPLVAGVQPFIDSLLAHKPDPRQIMVAALVGDPGPVAAELRPPPGSAVLQPALAPSCTYRMAPTPENAAGIVTADPAVRIAAFLDAFPGRSHLASICSPDLAEPLVAIGDAAKKLMGDPCIDTSNLADSSPAAGIQPICEVLDEDATTARPVPACADGATDCYELVADPARCPRSVDHLKLVRRRASPAAAAVWTRMRCVPR